MAPKLPVQDAGNCYPVCIAALILRSLVFVLSCAAFLSESVHNSSDTRTSSAPLDCPGKSHPSQHPRLVFQTGEVHRIAYSLAIFRTARVNPGRLGPFSGGRVCPDLGLQSADYSSGWSECALGRSVYGSCQVVNREAKA